MTKWAGFTAQLEAANEEGAFVTFPGFEWHSIAYGDRHVLLKGPAHDPVEGDDPAASTPGCRPGQP